MKKLLLFVSAVVLSSIMAFAQDTSVCEKFTYPEIIHRPRCAESTHCKVYPHLLHCEDLLNNLTHNNSGKLPACCWWNDRPGEGNGGRSSGEGKGGRAGLHGSGPNGLWMCHDEGAPAVQCDVTDTPPTSMKCCWKNPPVSTKGNEGNKPGKGNTPKVTPSVKGSKGQAKGAAPKAAAKSPAQKSTKTTAK